MHLTREEERIYNGDFGWAKQISMKILVRLGELFNATRLIPIDSAHVSGVSYKTLDDAPTEFLRALTNDGTKVKVNSTLNPQSIDREYLRKRLSSDICQKQQRIIECFETMGFSQSLTCTPYYLETPKKNAHLAWAESSAVVYANSVLGTWTNREGGPSALAAAIIGKTPNYGMHKAENRQPKALIKVEAKLRNEIEFGALGIFLGKILEDKIPFMQGLQDAPEAHLKQLGAALASTGMVNMFCYKDATTKPHGLEQVTVKRADIEQTINGLTMASKQKPDLVFLGCPHCSSSEIEHIANLVHGRKVKHGIECWVCTSRYVKENARRHVTKIEQSGAHVITDTCAVVTWTERLGIKTIMTNSTKTAYYAPTLNKAETILTPLKDCLNTAFEG